MSQEVDSLRAQVTQLQAEIQTRFATLKHENDLIKSQITQIKANQIPSDKLTGEDLTLPVSEYKPVKTKTVYFGSGWFTPKQNEAYKNAMAAIEENPTVDRENSYVPLEHQFHDIRVDEHPEYLHDKVWASGTFNGDLTGIKTTDVTLGVYIPDEEDVGLGTEISYGHGLGKYILLVIPDEDYGKPINLMSWGFADKVISMSELKTFDFNKPTYDYYNGAVY